MWCIILSWLPCLIFSCIRFLLTPYWNMMQYTLLAALPSPMRVSDKILIQIWCVILSSLPCLLLFSFLIEVLFQIWCTILSWLSCFILSCAGFLFNPYSNMMRYPILAALRRPVLVSDWGLIQIWCIILSRLPCLILYCIRFLLNPYWNMMQHTILAALPPLVLIAF